MRRTRPTLAMLAFAAGLCGALAKAQPAPGPTAAQLADTIDLGTVATLAPLCGLRDDGWAADLRRAAIQSATHTQAHDDPGLSAAPGSNLAIGALSSAEHEALETFAEAPAPDTCEPLAHDPALDRADKIVRSFRGQTPPAS
jgi:hypothetical protein